MDVNDIANSYYGSCNLTANYLNDYSEKAENAFNDVLDSLDADNLALDIVAVIEGENKVMLTLKQKRMVSKYLRANYSVYNIRFGADGAVTANREGKRGRFFMGWDCQLLDDLEKRKGTY